MNDVEALAPERLDEIQSRLNGVELHNLEVWEESWPACKGEALILDLGVGITDAHPDSDNAIFPVGVARLFANASQDITDLLAEVERLRALTTVDDAMVMRGAFALARRRAEDPLARDRVVGQALLVDAKAVLGAALGTGEGTFTGADCSV